MALSHGSWRAAGDGLRNCKAELLAAPLPSSLSRSVMVIELHEHLRPGSDPEIEAALAPTHLIERVPSSTQPPLPPVDLGFLDEKHQTLACMEIRAPPELARVDLGYRLPSRRNIAVMQRLSRRAALIAVVFAMSLVAGLVNVRAQTAASLATAPLTQAMPVDPRITISAPARRTSLLRARQSEARQARRVTARGPPGSVLERATSKAWRTWWNTWRSRSTLTFRDRASRRFSRPSACLSAPTPTPGDDIRHDDVLPDGPDHGSGRDRSRASCLKDWAHGVTFTDAAIERERGVVMEEWQLHLKPRGGWRTRNCRLS